jgi:phage tail tape-measure protein
MDDYTDLTDEERKLVKQLEDAQTTDEFGNMLGTGAGYAAGAGLTALTGGAAAPLIPVIGSLGGQIGSLIGGNIGANNATALQKKLQKSVDDRQRKGIEQEAKMRAFNTLLGKYSSF